MPISAEGWRRELQAGKQVNWGDQIDSAKGFNFPCPAAEDVVGKGSMDKWALQLGGTS